MKFRLLIPLVALLVPALIAIIYVFVSWLSKTGPPTFKRSGYTEYNERHLEDSIAYLTRAIEESPQSSDLYYRRARLYFDRFNLTAAERDVDTVIKLSSDTSPKALLMKSRISIRLGDWNTARRFLAVALEQGNDAQISDLAHLLNDLESQWATAKLAERRRDFGECYQISSALIVHSSHSKRIRKLHASCSFEITYLQQTTNDLIKITDLRDASADDFLDAARFSYFFTQGGDSTKALELLRECSLRYKSSHEKCTSLSQKVKKFEASFLMLARMYQSRDWMGLVSHLIHYGPNQTVTAGFLPTFDAELSRALSPVSFDAKQISKRRRMLASLLCISSENLDLNFSALFAWCRKVESRLVSQNVEPKVGNALRGVWRWLSS